MQLRGILEDQRIGEFVDLPNRMIKLIEQRDEILAIIRQIEDGNLITYFVLYRYALEIDSERTGTFYGSVVALKNCKASGSAIYMILIELAAQVAAYTQPQTGKFLVSLDKVPLREPFHLDFLKSSLMPIVKSSIFQQGRVCFVYEPKNKFVRTALLETALANGTLTEYQRCFISKSPRVNAYVKERGRLEYFAEQESTEEHLLSFGKSEKVDFQINLKPVPMLLDELKSLKQENSKLKEAKQQLGKRDADLTKEEQPIEEKAPQETEQNQSRIDKTSGSTNPADSKGGNNPSPHPESSMKNPAISDNTGIKNLLSRLRQSIARMLSIRGLIALVFALIAIFLVSLIVLLALGKDVPYLSDLLPTPENQETPRRSSASRTSPEALGPKQATESAKARELSEEQEKLWADIEAYLNEVGPNLNYDGGKMKMYKTQMERAEIQNTPQYQRFVNVYNNYMGSGLPHDMLVKKSITPEGRLRDISMDIISEEAPLTTNLLATYIMEKCPSFQSVFTASALENTIVNANPNDVDSQTRTITNSSGSIVFYVPRGATCNLN